MPKKLRKKAFEDKVFCKKTLEDLGQVPIIAINPRRDKVFKEELEAERSRLELIHFELPETVSRKKFFFKKLFPRKLS